MSDERQIGALREEIRRAGARLSAGRSFLWRLAMFVPLTMAALELYVRVRWEVLRFTTADACWYLLGEATFLTLAASAAGYIILPLVAGCRAMRRARLHHRLAALPPAELAAVLLPLRQDPHDDTRKLIAPLLRGVDVRTLEVVPAPPGGGRGSEPGPAEPPLEPGEAVTSARIRRRLPSSRARAHVLRHAARAVTSLVLCALPLTLFVVPLVPHGGGVVCGAPFTPWVVCVFNARSPSVPNEWEAAPPAGFSKSDRMIFTGSSVRAYRLRIGDSVYQLGRWCNMNCEPRGPGWRSESFSGETD
jgi:hypothetical protein